MIDHFLLVSCEEQVFSSRAGFQNVDGGEDSSFLQLPVENQLHVAGSFEFLVNHIVHLASCVHKSGGKNGKAAALAHVTGRAEEPFGHVQSRRVKTAGKCSAAGRDHQIIGAGQPCDGIQKDHHVFFMLYQSSGPFDDHLGNPSVVVRRLVEGGVDDFHVVAPDGFLDIRDFLGALVDQQDDQMDFGVIAEHRFCCVLKKGRLAGLGRRDDHASLSFSDGA